jgi:hypothetical protein
MNNDFINNKKYIDFRRRMYESLYYDTKNSMLNINFDLLEKVIDAKKNKTKKLATHKKINFKTKLMVLWKKIKTM